MSVLQLQALRRSTITIPAGVSLEHLQKASLPREADITLAHAGRARFSGQRFERHAGLEHSKNLRLQRSYLPPPR